MATTNIFVRENPTRTLVVRPATNRSQVCIVFTAQPGARQRVAAAFHPADTIDLAAFRPLVPRPVFGCAGVVVVDDDVFVAVVIEATKAADIEGQAIYRASRVAFYSLLTNKYDKLNVDPGPAAAASGSYTPEEQPTIVHPCHPLVKLLSGGSFYFSYSFDLTHRMEDRIAQAAEAQQQSPSDKDAAATTTPSIFDDIDLDFVWNRHILRHLLQMREQELTPTERANFDRGGHLLALTQGFVGTANVVAARSASWQLAMVSRLSANRAGTRYNARGINDDGHVSNFVETEFLIYNDAFAASFLQIRGSVPVFWEQTGVQVPVKIVFSRGPESSLPAATRHFEDLVRRYSTVQIVNLLSQSPNSGEYSLADAYRSVVAALPSDIVSSISYTTFDFHAIVKHDQYERLDDLFQNVRPVFDAFAYFLLDKQSKAPIFRQTGVIRTNCLDCLDRTNVVQMFLAKRFLDAYLSRISVRLMTYEQEAWNTAFNGLWADNGDWLSRIYTGTGALKSSYTRHGKQTVFGYLDDATKSVSRFYVSNFQDKGRQEAIDMLFSPMQVTSGLLMRNSVHEIVEKQMESRLSEYARPSRLFVLTGTYNLNGKMLRGETLDSWLKWPRDHSPVLIVIGVQELIELTPGQYISADTNMLRLLWESIFLKSINDVQPDASYVVLRSLHLVALGLFAFVREDATQNVRKVETSVIKTGLGGMAANKGGIGLSLNFHDTSMVFVTAHFAAGNSAVEERNRDYSTITNGLGFRGRKVYDHDMMFWLGDFNYRLTLANDEARSRIHRGDILSLSDHDQLIEQMRAGRIFDGFTEGALSFAPTYKYDNGSTVYDTSEKARTPSWTDRILFKGRHIQLIEYARGEQLMSDHRPVRALFAVQANVIDFKKKDVIYAELLKQAYTAAIEGGMRSLQKPLLTGNAGGRNGDVVRSATPPPLPPRNLSAPVSAAISATAAPVTSGVLIDLTDDMANWGGVSAASSTLTSSTNPPMSPVNNTASTAEFTNNPFLPSDPLLWNQASGPLPPPSSDTSKWWLVPDPIPPPISFPQPPQSQSSSYTPGIVQAAGAPVLIPNTFTGVSNTHVVSRTNVNPPVSGISKPGLSNTTIANTSNTIPYSQNRSLLD